MHLQLKGKIDINAPADQVWQVIAHNYGDIGQWAAMIPASSAITGGPAPDGAPVAGRVCSAQGFGDVREQFTYYDESARRFGYIAAEGLPSFISRAENNWSVRSLGPDISEVTMRGEIDFPVFPGLLLMPIFKLVMGRKGKQMAEELKYFVENDEPHPRKQKQLRQAAAHA